jgi:hypothetical protein
MKPHLKVMLSVVGVAAMLVSPAMAASTSRHHNTVRHYTAPARGYVPGGAYGYAPPNRPTMGDSWCAIRRSWDACHDPLENPQL